MASKSFLNLPPITPQLKSIAPYLQRAEEVKNQEPIVAYWCAYYAAQIGIGLKARDSPSRDLLLALLGALEKLKGQIGPNDAVDVDAAGAAYVENFALKIFTSADNEDRDGRATRTTAKRFLAAANFLEVLKTFPASDVSETSAEKAKYAKWKAADIAKAFREGRKPTPGPPGAAQDPLAEELETQIPTSISPPKPPGRHPSPPRSPPRSPRNIPPAIPIPPSNQPRFDEGWSTIATPGTELNASVTFDNQPLPDSGSPSHKRSNSGSSSQSGSGRRSPKRTAWVSEEMEGRLSPSPVNSNNAPTISRSPTGGSRSKPPSPTPRSRTSSPAHEKKVQFSPSVAGGSESSGPRSPTVSIRANLSSSSADTVQPARSRSPRFSPPLPPPPTLPSSHTKGPIISPRYAVPPPPPPPIFELTAAVVTKAQKHCRFASSALDYEDAETARKELRAALALLGG
ncbi:DUF605-domain-containing protein [Coprinopsis marcescibilis]|uniref:DUF605-domain-containing protein n=1 Tax=Coprinopsis marcescibilis TaxID=230819 RepID=A0A5C3LG98_COPMA|nr:DUF605-domain-containing protein [Coprinopsis marcescibilis]